LQGTKYLKKSKFYKTVNNSENALSQLQSALFLYILLNSHQTAIANVLCRPAVRGGSWPIGDRMPPVSHSGVLLALYVLQCVGVF